MKDLMCHKPAAESKDLQKLLKLEGVGELRKFIEASIRRSRGIITKEWSQFVGSIDSEWGQENF